MLTYFKMKRFLVLCCLNFPLFLFSQTRTLIPFGSEWKYFKGTNHPSNFTLLWIEPGFNDNAWSQGNMPFWYGDGTGGVQLNDMQNSYTTMYFRKKLTIDSASKIESIDISVNYDDGFRLWINSKMILEMNAASNNLNTSTAPLSHESGIIEQFHFVNNDVGLKDGENIISIIGFNNSLTSSDFHLNIEITVHLKTERASPVKFSQKGGFCQNPFNVTISAINAGDSVLYTLDCTDPQSSRTVFKAVSPVTVRIDPDNTVGRPHTPAVVLRASALKTEKAPSYPVTCTYIFLEKVKKQVYPGGDWPDSNINSQIIDYNMDPNVVNSSQYKNLITTALLQIPSVSLVTDNKNLFDPATGIYVNAMSHGIEWERPASFELINPNDTEQININCGLRIRGGWSRHPEDPKHAFRLFFREEYGAKKLNYPLFENEGVDVFDKIDLRTPQNYSWSYYGDSRMTMTRDVFCRDLQGKMGQPYTRSRFYHLYLNGMYWGIYQSEERPEARFAESYFGGNSDNYDVIKIEVQTYTVEATDGNMNKWQDVWKACQRGFINNEDYFKLIGRNKQGEIDTSLEALVDIDNLIDYMINIFYSGNFDAPVTKFGNNKGPNNFYAIKDRTEKRDGFKFFIHDAEHVFQANPAPPGVGVSENRVNIGDLTDQYQMTVSGLPYFHPQWLHFKLSDNAEYRLRFADHAYKYLYNNGLFTPAVSEAWFRKRVNEIDMAIIAESARWGDSKSWDGSAKTKDNAWIPAVNEVINGFIKKRTPIVIAQLKAEKLLPSIDPPVFKKDGLEIKDEQVQISNPFSLEIVNNNGKGSIILTYDGSDPRQSDGSINPVAIRSNNNFSVTINSPVHIRARVLDGEEWSAVHDLFISNNLNLDKIKITEISYHPPDTGIFNGKDIEFIEFKNTADVGVNLEGVKIDSAVNYTFPNNTFLYPNDFAVIASNKNKFEHFYGIPPTGEYMGHLANEGEKILIIDKNNNPIISMRYLGSLPWPLLANGAGYSLVSKVFNPTGDPNDPLYWRSSYRLYGSPFADDKEIIDAITLEKYGNRDGIFIIYPNPTNGELNLLVIKDIEILSLSLIDLQGKVLMNEVLGKVNSNAVLTFNLQENVSTSGIYLLKIQLADKILIKKVIYSK